MANLPFPFPRPLVRPPKRSSTRALGVWVDALREFVDEMRDAPDKSDHDTYQAVRKQCNYREWYARYKAAKGAKAAAANEKLKKKAEVKI